MEKETELLQALIAEKEATDAVAGVWRHPAVAAWLALMRLLAFSAHNGGIIATAVVAGSSPNSAQLGPALTLLCCGRLQQLHYKALERYVDVG